MLRWVRLSQGSRRLSRLAGCALAMFLGGLAAALLLAGAARPAWAAAAQARAYPGSFPCDTSLQACIDGVNDGDTIIIAANTYITSLTLSKPVSLTGVNSATVILQALPNQRVLTVTGVTVDSSVVISGLTFTGGDQTGLLGAGGGILLTDNAQPRLENIRVINNQASFAGGGIFGWSVRLVNSLVQSNTVALFGGGVATFGNAHISGSRVEANTCTLDACEGGGLFAFAASVTNTAFVTNTARMRGGGLIALTAVTLTGGLVERNACTQAGCLGGGLMTSGTLSLNGANVISNTSDFHGGGAYVVSATTATGGVFRANRCITACAGGGLYSNGALIASGSVFTDNVAVNGGGALWVEGATSLTNVQMWHNACTAAGCYGGGLRAVVTADVSGGQFISNTSAGRGGGLALGHYTQYPGYPMAITNALVMSNTASEQGGGLLIYGFGALSGGQFVGNSGSYGGGAYVYPQVIVSGTQYVNNRSVSGGGGMAGGDSASVTGALFQGNACTGGNCGGGGLAALGATVYDSDFISNTAQGYGGGIGAYGIGVTGGSFHRNACLDPGCQGGGLRGQIGVNIIGAEFISNTAQGYGGGAYSDGGGGITGALFQQNHAVEMGGGYFSNEQAGVMDSAFVNNTAGTGGGGIRGTDTYLNGAVLQGNACQQAGCLGGGLLAQAYLNDVGLLDAVDTQFIQNTSRGGGGAAAVSSTTTLSGSVLAGNACTEAGCLGGGLRADSGLAITATEFLGNRAAGMGGGVAHQSGDGSVVNTLFARNSAGTAGAALYLASGGAVDVVHTTIASPTLGAGAAIDVVSGTVQIIDTLVASYSVGLRRLSAGVGSPGTELEFAL